MVLNITRFLSLLFTALIAGVAFCHVLERPNKLTLPASTWLQVQQHLYNEFGPVAGSIEVAAVVSTLALLFLVRKRRIAFMWTLIASVCLVAALTLWFMVVNPVNLLVNNWTIASLPDNWQQARNRWEYGHTIHAVLFAIALVASILAVLSDTTTSNTRNISYKSYK